MRELRVLYVTDGWDAPYRYRCLHACEQLRADAVVANVVHLEHPRLLEKLERYSVIVLFRLPWNARTEAIVDGARRGGQKVVFDVDDLVFDPAVADQMPFRRRFTLAEWQASYGWQMAALRRTFEAADFFIGSTPALAEHAAALGKSSSVHPNVVPRAYLRMGRRLSRFRRSVRAVPTIGYFSGSNTHDEDFASVADAVVEVLSRRPDARLLVCGHLGVGASLRRFDAQVVALPYMHWRSYAWAFAACHVILAPLASRNLFTDCKSPLKFFEPGAFHVPTIATPSRPMRAAIEDGQSGFLATSTGQWVEAMLESLDDRRSEQLGDAARATVERRYSAQAVRGRLAGVLGRFAVEPRGRPPALLPLPDGGEAGKGRMLRDPARPLKLAGEVADILRAVGRPADAGPDWEAVERWLDCMARGVDRRRRAVELGVSVLVDGADHHWRPNEQLSSSAAIPGEVESLGSDPQWRSPEVSIDLSRYRYVAVRMRVSASRPTATAQLYFRPEDGSGFDEALSITFPVATDGSDQAYVADLRRTPALRQWAEGRRALHVRFDPLDCAGSVRLSALALLPEDTSALRNAWGEWPDPPAEVSLPEGSEAVDAIVRVTKEAPQQTRFIVHTDSNVADLRRIFSEAAKRSASFVVDTIRNGDGVASAEIVACREPSRPVDVVVPVFNARELTIRCLQSVMRHATGDFRLVVIDDASTDETVRPALEAFVRRHSRATLLVNEKNLGFVASANRGFRHAAGRDVLLLNSDTEVFEGFLDRLRDAAHSDLDVAMVSPLSNNATICSVPDFCRVNGVPAGMTREEMARLVRDSSRRLRPDLVTPHGFCLYLRADFLREMGGFDEELFGRGFGEENDLGERAKQAGWRTRLADDVYVWHEGKASFKSEGLKLEAENAPVLEKRHPGYHAAIAHFVRTNPLSSVHDTLHLHLKRRTHAQRAAPLILLHENPFEGGAGGVAHCVRDLMEAIALPRVVLVYPTGSALEVAEIVEGRIDTPLFFRFPIEEPVPRFCLEHEEATVALKEVLTLFHIGWVHIHHLMYWPLSVAEVLDDEGLPYGVTIHDFYFGCPSFNLLDVRNTTSCCPASCRDPARTASCVRALFDKLGQVPPADAAGYVDRHRARMRHALEKARWVTAPSESTRRLVCELLAMDESRIAVSPHGYRLAPAHYITDSPRKHRGFRGEQRAPGVPARSDRKDGPLRVALVGEISYPSKGAEAYLETLLLCRTVSVEWHVFGRTDRFDFERRLDRIKARIVRHGKYERATIVPKLRRTGVDAGLLLPAWPETFSYTLTELLSAGVPVIATRIGALEDRLRGRRYATLVDTPAQAAEAIERLSSRRDELEEMKNAALDFAPRSTQDWAEQFVSLYEDCRRSSPVREGRAPSKRDYSRLNAAHVAGVGLPTETGVAVTQPSGRYTARWWYPHAERLKAYVPESVRAMARRQLAADGMRPVRRFRFPGPGVTVGGDLQLEKKYLRTARFVAMSGDPHLVLAMKPLNPDEVRFLRFNLWCSHPGFVFAQLYWRREGEATFGEERSMTIPLNGQAAAWQEYVLRLDAQDRSSSFYEGGPIVELRFDPINLPGPVCLGELALCARQK